MRAIRTLIVTCTTVVTLGILALAAPGRAHADEGKGMGVGAQRTLAGVNGGTFVYDAGPWHVGGLLGFVTINQPGDDFTGFALGGQFLYHMHATSNSDFGLGGGLTVVSADDVTNFDVEALAQIRVFLVSNVALTASLGLLIVVGDDDGLILGGDLIFAGGGGEDTAIAVGGQVNGSMGITYFFD